MKARAAERLTLDQIAEALASSWRRPVPAPPTALRPGRSRFLTYAASRERQRTRWDLLALAFDRASSGGGGALARPLGSLVRVAAALAVALILVTPLSHGMVRAARSSSPGQLLYPLKIQVERVQYAGAEQPDVRVALSLAFLGERVAEVQALVQRQQALGDGFPSEAQQLTLQLLQAIAGTPEATLPDVLRYTQLQLGAYMEVLIALEPFAGDGSAQSLAGMTQACRRAYLLTTRALVYPEDFRIAYSGGRPELFLLPGERPLVGGSMSIDQVTVRQEETPL